MQVSLLGIHSYSDKKNTLVVDNDTTVHDAHTDTVAFSPTVMIKCSIRSGHQTLTRTPHEWLEKQSTANDT